MDPPRWHLLEMAIDLSCCQRQFLSVCMSERVGQEAYFRLREITYSEDAYESKIR